MELVDLGPQAGIELQLPPALLGKLGNDPAKKTVRSGCNMHVFLG